MSAVVVRCPYCSNELRECTYCKGMYPREQTSFVNISGRMQEFYCRNPGCYARFRADLDEDGRRTRGAYEAALEIRESERPPQLQAAIDHYAHAERRRQEAAHIDPDFYQRSSHDGYSRSDGAAMDRYAQLEAIRRWLPTSAERRDHGQQGPTD